MQTDERAWNESMQKKIINRAREVGIMFHEFLSSAVQCRVSKQKHESGGKIWWKLQIHTWIISQECC